MLSEARQDFLIELIRWDGGLSLMPGRSGTPRLFQFQGGLIYSKLIEVQGQVLTPSELATRPMRIFLNPLETWDVTRSRPPDIGYICDRTGQLPGGGLEAFLKIPPDSWTTAIHCLSTVWRQLSLTGVNGDGQSMRLSEISFSSGDALSLG